MGLPLHDVSGDEVLDYVSDVVAAGEQAVILHVNVFAANLAARDAQLRGCFDACQLVFCDGDGIRWGLKIIGEPAPEKVTYSRWMWRLAKRCEEQGLSLYLLGAKPGVADRAAERLQKNCPKLRIAGTHDGYFEKSGPQNDAVIDEINRAQPDVMLVCLGMPVQEHWLRENAPRLAVHALLTGGAALDYASGDVPMTPAWMVRSQTEWLYRLVREPVRLFSRYIVGNPQFITRAVAERVRRQTRRMVGRGIAVQRSVASPRS
jgi:N-acetylglucosaminyldiphosphoundecaprenol N-acetyl-beta-D-mannosaminyltransferase